MSLNVRRIGMNMLFGCLPAGWSSHNTWAASVQEYGLMVVDLASSLTKQGPFSVRRANVEEQPGPPVNQTCETIKRKKKRMVLVSSASTREPVQKSTS